HTDAVPESGAGRGARRFRQASRRDVIVRQAELTLPAWSIQTPVRRPVPERPNMIANRFRRRLFVAALVALVVLTGSDGARASHLGDGKKHRIVYQLDDPGVDKTLFVLNNIQNHVKGVGGWKNIEALELVVFGPALKNFVTKDMDARVSQSL